MPESRRAVALRLLEGGPAKVHLTGPKAAVEAANLRWMMYHLRKQDLEKFGNLSFSLVACTTEATIFIEAKPTDRIESGMTVEPLK